MEIPKAQKIDKVLSIHDDQRIDNYFWMNQREDQKVIDYLNQENQYFDANFPKDGLRKQIFDEMVAKVKKDDDTVPYLKNGYFHQTTYSDDSEYPVYNRRKSGSEEVEIVLNVNELAKDEDFCQVGGVNYSPNNKILAYGIDIVGRRIFKIKFLNLESKEYDNIILEGAQASFTFQNDNSGYYTSKDPITLRSYKIMSHQLGTPQDSDICVIEKR
jgi:oligopeptidase B